MAVAVTRVVERLRAADVHLDRGLSDAEVGHVQEQLGFVFGPEHRELMQSVLPIGDKWPNWRSGALHDLRRRLDRPVEGVLFDVHQNGFWPASWGRRPDTTDDLDAHAREHLARLPRLVPIYAHRYLASDPAFDRGPVFSVSQSDVIVYGDNLLDYVAHEFGVGPPAPSNSRVRVPFWSDLAHGAEDSDL